MFTTNDYQQLTSLINSSPESYELIQKLMDSYQFTISKISHELRNPLTLIYSTLQLIESQHPEVKEFRHWPQMIEDVEYTTDLLNELSTYNNSQHLNLKTFDFQKFMQHIAVSFAASITDTNIEFTSKIDDSLPQINGDKTKLQEVFLNLLKNAQEAVGPNGTIRLESFVEDHTIITQICDDGCGIEPDRLDTIFTPFVTYKQGGSGLGLPIVHTTILAHKGSVSVDSVEGKGACFTVSLPI